MDLVDLTHTIERSNTRFLTVVHFRPLSRWERVKRLMAALLSVLLFGGCTSIKQIGAIGPKSLPVFSIRDTGFLSEGRMLVVLNQDGNVGAATGGAVAGPGPLFVSIVGTVVMAGAVAYAATSLSDAIRGMSVTARGNVSVSVPKAVDVNVVSP